jgi:hypothetical protein
MSKAPEVWPMGAMISDREAKDPSECSCCHYRIMFQSCGCLPIAFMKDRRLEQTGEGGMFYVDGCCACAPWWTLPDFDIMAGGKRVTLEQYASTGFCKCGVENCCEDELHVKMQGQVIGKVYGRCVAPWTAYCSEWVRKEVADANGNIKYQQWAQPLLCRFRERRVETLKDNWHEVSFPIYKPGEYEQNGDPAAYEVWRYWMHPCVPCFSWCRPFGNGVKDHPDDATETDQILLQALTWRHLISKTNPGMVGFFN